MVRPHFPNLKANYYRGVRCVMRVVSARLEAAPEDTEVFFGDTSGENAIHPNYQVTCSGKSFVFGGVNHHPYAPLPTDPPDQLRQPDRLHEGSFNQHNLIPEGPHGLPYTEIDRYAIEETGDDDGLEETLTRYYEHIPLPEEARRAPGVISPNKADEEPYDPANADDGREQVMRAIKTRRGQTTFRQALVKAYEGRCAITGCAVLDVLEAAHITPYLGPPSNHVTNGILLRADLHTLFDLLLIAINPGTLEIIVHPSLRSSDYADLHQKKITPPSNRNDKPSEKALKQHLEDCKFSG